MRAESECRVNVENKKFKNIRMFYEKKKKNENVKDHWT